jgi:hypothetical protein
MEILDFASEIEPIKVTPTALGGGVLISRADRPAPQWL